MKDKGAACKWYSTLIALILCMFFLGETAYSAEKRIVLKKYPTLKVGFTTQNFAKFLPVSPDSAKKLIDYAADQGFSWVELRDPNAVLTLDECRQIADYARGRNIEIIYALGAGIRDIRFWEIFSRGLANAAVFHGPRIIRTGLAGEDFLKDTKKKAWTLPELAKLVYAANKAANLAKAHGLTYAVENARETIKGDGITSFGATEFFANVNANVGLQPDSANFFSISRVLTKPEEAQAFLEMFASKIRYTHLKTSSKEHKALQVLAANELDFDTIFSLLVKSKAPYVAIELDQADSLDACYGNMKKSAEYLLSNF
jgi:sugar phosphate isomerase/epimerase